jgi:hypothetical protein
VREFIGANITAFHDSRITALETLKLNELLKRKNPYLFKAKNIDTAQDLVKNLLDAYLSSKEESVFGEFLERLAVFCCSLAYGGRKSGIEGIDMELEKDGVKYLFSIKSGPNWGNSRQVKKLSEDFVKAQRILRTTGADVRTAAVNGCCYGKDGNPDKGTYYKYCGQEFWAFITGQDDFYIRLIEPLGHNAKAKNEEFYKNYAKTLNRFTKVFIEEYCGEDGAICWEKIVKLNSGKPPAPRGNRGAP